MESQRGGPRGGEPRVLIDDPRTCVVQHGPALVSIRRAVLTGPDLADFCEAVEETGRVHERIVLLAAFRIDRRFPVPPNFQSHLPLLARALRMVQAHITAIASVVEFEGLLAKAMRATSRATWALAQPRCELDLFSRVSDAAQWLAPHAAAVGAPQDLRSYVSLYRTASERLRRHDLSPTA